jgi:hypothetical protein
MPKSLRERKEEREGGEIEEGRMGGMSRRWEGEENDFRFHLVQLLWEMYTLIRLNLHSQNTEQSHYSKKVTAVH